MQLTGRIRTDLRSHEECRTRRGSPSTWSIPRHPTVCWRLPEPSRTSCVHDRWHWRPPVSPLSRCRHWLCRRPWNCWQLTATALLAAAVAVAPDQSLKPQPQKPSSSVRWNHLWTCCWSFFPNTSSVHADDACQTYQRRFTSSFYTPVCRLVNRGIWNLNQFQFQVLMHYPKINPDSNPMPLLWRHFACQIIANLWQRKYYKLLTAGKTVSAA